MARPPAVAGQFYPDDPVELAGAVDAMLAAASSAPETYSVSRESGLTSAAPVTSPGVGSEGRAAAYVVPHAGYRYSGPTAAHAYARLRGRSDVDRIVLLGPSHFVALRGCAVPAADTWLTPLGEVPLDVTGAGALVAAGLATMDDEPHGSEHSLEVQLPFLQRALGAVRVLPIAVGVSDVDGVAAAVALAAKADRTVVICSTDLSHYLDQDQADARDEQTVGAIAALAPEQITAEDACGAYALRAILSWARQAELTARILHRCTSASTGGPASRVVGYAAVEFSFTKR